MRPHETAASGTADGGRRRGNEVRVLTLALGGSSENGEPVARTGSRPATPARQREYPRRRGALLQTGNAGVRTGLPIPTMRTILEAAAAAAVGALAVAIPVAVVYAITWLFL